MDNSLFPLVVMFSASGFGCGAMAYVRLQKMDGGFWLLLAMAILSLGALLFIITEAFAKDRKP